ncbi:MAG: 4Fe-4S binding protein [Firmicutes bacterium]|nr:4Fe-4S binding protein [Bacillota bacterium]
MKRIINFIKNRSFIQFIATLLTNIHLPNFFKGTIYTGGLKRVCVPGLNCYSCPGATGACPIGAFQATVGSRHYKFAYYIVGILIFFGVMVGRLICGFLCPFGWFQDLLHKIPSKKFSTKKLKPLRYIKYIIMIVVVWLLCVIAAQKTGLSLPYFCKYICPQGILEGGIPLSIKNQSIRNALGSLFTMKSIFLAITIIASIFFYRPFCKWICPLGAFYSLFNKVSFFQIYFDSSKCINCNRCVKACKMDVNILQNQAHGECIRCLDCVKACPKAALYTSLTKSKERESNNNEKCKKCNFNCNCSATIANGLPNVEK